MRRLLTDIEKLVIFRVAEKLPQEKRLRLLDDLKHATVESTTPDGARVVFGIFGYNRPPYRGQQSMGVDGELLDKDGAKLSFDLYADENGRLLEMELIRWDERALIDPDWSALKLY